MLVAAVDKDGSSEGHRYVSWAGETTLDARQDVSSRWNSHQAAKVLALQLRDPVESADNST
jgi:phage gp37-like protein